MPYAATPGAKTTLVPTSQWTKSMKQTIANEIGKAVWVLIEIKQMPPKAVSEALRAASEAVDNYVDKSVDKKST